MSNSPSKPKVALIQKFDNPSNVGSRKKQSNNKLSDSVKLSGVATKPEINSTDALDLKKLNSALTLNQSPVAEELK